jgi:two-component system sensor histidine kinase BaeS
MRSLRARITLVVVAVAVLAVLVTSLVALQLVRSSTNQEARAQLAAQADALSALPSSDPILDDTTVAVISPSGDVTGEAAALVDRRLLTRLANDDSISTIRRAGGHAFLVEARSTSDGGAIVLALPQARVDRIVAESAWRIALALAIGVLVAVVAGALLAAWLTRPIARTARAARRLASGERGVELAVDAPTEVAAIASALTALDAALTTSEGRQREFLLSISHELRTPLTAVRGYAEALADGLIPAAEVAAVGATLVAETQRLDRFVADLLELARLESEDFSIRPREVELGEVLQSAAAAWAGRASQLGVALDVEGSATASTDPERVRQLVDGLIENALRVTRDGSAVSLSVRVDDDVVIEVADGGPGLSASDAAIAFERGMLRERYRDARPVGTGLGLSIAARLAARLGGSITAGSAPGGGALFTVRLPR